MSKRSQLLESIAETIADYREGEIESPTPEHVDTWVNQFDKEVQKPMLAELDYVLKRTYFSKENVKDFLAGLVKNEKLAGNDPCSFWTGVEFLRIQGGGNSQREMLAMFDEVLQDECDFGVTACGGSKTFIYIDDVIFTGNRVLSDLKKWIQSDAPKKAQVHVIVMAYHRSGQWYADKNIKTAMTDAGKQIDFHWWRVLEIENRKAYKNVSEILWPERIPDDAAVADYVAMLEREGYPPDLRNSKGMGNLELFSSVEGRDLLEQEFLKAGARIKVICPFLGDTQRPLGHSTLKTLGFGGLIVTFRNCPNNTPLAFWAGDPWYPLFPRKTN